MVDIRSLFWQVQKEIAIVSSFVQYFTYARI